MGTILLLFPNQVLPYFGLPVAGEVWIRLLGFVLTCSSVYYIGAGLLQWLPFANWTIYTRVAAPLVVAALIFTQNAPWHLASFGIVDGLGAMWTWLAIRNDVRKAS
ncbi:MAG: hypothetical protein H7X70_05080 [Candidatus Kapabacteria bacterium]|nr:hypothetical protein [Candidatus Kapabacteria bacterium]